jgi:cytochrome c-type biogenesis protein CcmH/NrfF
LFTWIPLGPGMGVKTEDLLWLYPVLVLVVAWLLLDKLLSRRR